MQIDVRARRVSRQLGAIDARESIELGVAGDVLNGRDARVNQARLMGRQMRGIRDGGRGGQTVHAGDR